MHQSLLIFTDLDGTLLDHHSYSHAPAKPLLHRLKQLETPVIPVTSKTYAELLPLRKELDNSDPFITENGAAVYIPDDYFAEPTENCEKHGKFYRYSLSEPRSIWQKLLQNQLALFPNEFTTFTELGTSGIVECTGLSHVAAELANKREFSEPVLWNSTDERKIEFVAALKEAGATVLQGGRFLHVTGNCDKGQALTWLTEQFRLHKPDSKFITIAAGDGENDVDMLEVVDKAIIIRSPVNPLPKVSNSNLYISNFHGPQGWSESIIQQAGISFPDQQCST